MKAPTEVDFLRYEERIVLPEIERSMSNLFLLAHLEYIITDYSRVDMIYRRYLSAVEKSKRPNQIVDRNAIVYLRVQLNKEFSRAAKTLN